MQQLCFEDRWSTITSTILSTNSTRNKLAKNYFLIAYFPDVCKVFVDVLCKYYLFTIYTPVHTDYIDKTVQLYAVTAYMRSKALLGLITLVRCASSYDYGLIELQQTITSAQNIFKQLFTYNRCAYVCSCGIRLAFRPKVN